MITQDLNHDLTFYCTHDQLWLLYCVCQCLEYLEYITLPLGLNCNIPSWQIFENILIIHMTNAISKIPIGTQGDWMNPDSKTKNKLVINILNSTYWSNKGILCSSPNLKYNLNLFFCLTSLLL